MKNLMRALRDVIIAGVIVLAGIGFMPQEVWAANSTSIDSSKSATVGDTGVTVTATFELETGYTFKYNYNPTSAISNVDDSVSGNTLTFKFDAAAAGTATVKVWIEDNTVPDTPVDGTEKTCTITVSAATPKTITLSQTTMSLYKGENGTLTATCDYSGYDLEWSTSNASVATCSGSGLTASVAGVGVGSCNITVKDKNNPSVTASCAVTVTNLSGTAIVLDKTTATGTVNDSFDIIASATPVASVADITFVSSNTNIVDDGTPGALTGGSRKATFDAVGAGEATITATAEFSDGSHKTATCKVKINPAINDVSIIEGSFDSVAAGYKSVNYTPVLDIDYGWGSTSLTKKDITWSTSDATKATVTKNADGTIICVNGLKKTTTDVDIKATIANQTFTVGTIAVEQPATGFKTTTNAAEMNNPTTIVYEILPADSDATYVEFECTSAPTGVDKDSVISGDVFIGPAVGPYTIKATVDNSGIATYGTAGTVKNYSTTFPINVTTPATGFDLANPVYVTNGFSRNVSQFVTLAPSGSAIINSTISSGDTSKITTNGSSTITGKAVGDTTVTVDVNGLGSQTHDAKVLEKPSIEYKDKKLEIEQPSGVYTDKSSTIKKVARGVIKVYYDGDCLWTSDKKEEYADGKEISAEKIQSIIKEDKIYDKLKNLDKDKATLQFRVYGADKNNYNEQAYGEDDVDVYRITVSGTGVNTTKYYGVKGANISLNATAATGYSNAKFKDSDSSTKSVTVDGSATYTATAEKSGASNSTGAGANGANGAGGASGSNSKYDKVPKTGEAGDVWAMWVVFLACIVAAGAVFVVRIKPEILMKGKDNKK